MKIDSAARDRAFGRYYSKHGLRVGRSDQVPAPEQRISAWASRYFRLPADKRNPPTRITLPETTMAASVTDIFSRINVKPDYRQIAVSDVRNALRNVPEHRVVIAQSRALRSLDRGVALGKAIERAIAWARCAIDPSDPTPPNVA